MNNMKAGLLGVTIKISLLIMIMSLTCYSQTSRAGSEQVPHEVIVAKINNKQAISQQEVDEMIAIQLGKLKDQIYDLRKAALDNLLIKRILSEEAATKGITVEELKRQMVPAKVEIDQRDVDRAYLENSHGLGNMSEEEAKVRIRIEIEARAKADAFKKELEKLKKKASIEIFLSQPAPVAHKTSLDGPSKGSGRPLVTIVEFSDFQCPFCKQAAGILNEVLPTYKEEVRLIYKHVPLPIHPQAFKAAQASVCANEQEKFWEYHDRIFSGTSLSEESLIGLAQELGLEMNQFQNCLGSEASRVTVMKDLEEAKRLQIEATPTFIINGRVVRGIRNASTFRNLIDDEIRKAKQNRAAF